MNIDAPQVRSARGRCISIINTSQRRGGERLSRKGEIDRTILEIGRKGRWNFTYGIYQNCFHPARSTRLCIGDSTLTNFRGRSVSIFRFRIVANETTAIHSLPSSLLIRSIRVLDESDRTLNRNKTNGRRIIRCFVS